MPYAYNRQTVFGHGFFFLRGHQILFTSTKKIVQFGPSCTCKFHFCADSSKLNLKQLNIFAEFDLLRPTELRNPILDTENDSQISVLLEESST